MQEKRKKVITKYKVFRIIKEIYNTDYVEGSLIYHSEFAPNLSLWFFLQKDTKHKWYKVDLEYKKEIPTAIRNYHSIGYEYQEALLENGYLEYVGLKELDISQLNLHI